MTFYPINVMITAQPCLVVGGGSVAERKVKDLLKAGAAVTVLSPVLSEALAQLAARQEICHVAEHYHPGAAQPYFLVIAATDQKEVNRQVAADAKEAGRLVNVIDNPDNGNFQVPSQVVRGDLLLTVSTGGKSPALSRQLGRELAQRYGPEYGTYLELLAKVRAAAKDCIPTSKEREEFWRQALDGEILTLLQQGKIKEAEAKIENAIGCFRTQS